MTKVISIIMRKGGSGKTTTAVNLATALSQKNKKVLVIDLDPQANATMASGYIPEQFETNVNSIFTSDEINPQQCIYQTQNGYHLISANESLAGTESGMTGDNIYILKEKMKDIISFYDYVILDTPPSESALTISALAMTDWVIFPLHTHYFGLQGLKQAFSMLERAKAINPDIELFGILPTLVQKNTVTARLAIEQAKKNHPNYLLDASIEYSVRQVEASAKGKTLVMSEPNHPSAKGYVELADIIIERNK